jgi:Flp pilus assembly protein TadG
MAGIPSQGQAGTLKSRRTAREPVRGESGAALIEFALLLPVFMMLVIGMFTGGLAYNSKLSLTAATRESSRLGATLPISPDCGSAGTKVNDWLTCLATVTVNSSDGELASGVSSRYVCVSYVNPSGTLNTDDATQITTTREVTGAAAPVFSSTDCFAKNGVAGGDGFPSSQARVQIYVSRTRNLEAIFFTQSLTLKARSVTLYEK